jgi:hypothetical protein
MRFFGRLQVVDQRQQRSHMGEQCRAADRGQPTHSAGALHTRSAQEILALKGEFGGWYSTHHPSPTLAHGS